jgi:anti-sigma factor RsiW
MSHLDEGTLHALLDGELSTNDAREVQSHLGTCAACGSRLQEVKQFLAEADRLVGVLEVPAGPAASAPLPQGRSRPSPPRGSAFREPEMWDEPPVLLLPDNADALARKRRWMAVARWAAIVTLVVGGGRGLMSLVGGGNSLPAARDITTATRSVPPAVVSPQETGQPATRTPAAARPSRPPAENRALASRKAVPQAKAAGPAPILDTTPLAKDTTSSLSYDSAPVDSQTLATAPATDSASPDSTLADTEPRATQARPTPRAEDDAATRRAAAEALAELDRQRRKERAAAATAALARPAPARPDVAPAPAESAPAPAPRTPEQRAQIYMRIGLDEAVKQLGGPVHVIEGMTPELIGLTNGRVVPGADQARPVVRVVYLDTRGRMILLDQQRLRPGQAAPGATEGNLRWAVGDVLLYLRGEPGPDVLRSLQRRVR